MKTLFKVIFGTLAAAALPMLAAGQSKPVPAPYAFWNELNALCGKAFAGKVETDTTDDARFKNKPMVMHVRSCEKDRIRIPFVVGDDRSRTWVFTRTKTGMTLKHDHRHEDGAPDAVTMYGGTTSNSGLATRQHFPADEETIKIIPAAAGNMWWTDLVKGEYFTYNLRRMGTDRLFTVKFDLSKEVAAPAAPWAWKD
jgi:hypothetical protein